jgi:hypothetical protein
MFSRGKLCIQTGNWDIRKSLPWVFQQLLKPIAFGFSNHASSVWETDDINDSDTSTSLCLCLLSCDFTAPLRKVEYISLHIWLALANRVDRSYHMPLTSVGLRDSLDIFIYLSAFLQKSWEKHACVTPHLSKER